MELEKFDIILVNLNPPKGHVQAGVRPAIIVQSNLFNPYASTVMIVPLTTKMKKIFPSEFVINPSGCNGLLKTSRFLGSQVMTVDRGHIVKKQGSLEKKYYSNIQEALKVSLDWENDFV